MKKLLIFALMGIALPSFAVNSVKWEILQNPVDGSGGFPGTASGRQLFVDFNNDGILDYFIISGQGNTETEVIGLFKGNADGTYTDVTEASEDLYAKSCSSALFIDIDNDGNLDLITVGKNGGDAFTDVYKNSGAPDYKFVADWEMAEVFPGLSTESNDNGTKILVAFDYNNDGWTDLLINGNAGGQWEAVTGGNDQSRVVAIMKNNKGTFELLENPVNGTENFISLNGGSVDAADFNCDGYMDILVTGYNDDLSTVTKLYKNNGNDTFTEVTGIDFVGHQQGETAFIDVNNDGYADIIEIGRDVKNGWTAFGKLYINNQDGTFTRHEEEETTFFGGGCALAIADVNNDGLTDYFMSGWATNSTFMWNNGDNTFTKEDLVPKTAICRGGSTTFAHIDKDGFIDLSLFGYHDDDGNGSGWPDYILFNKGGDGVAANAAPAAPKNVMVSYNAAKKCYEVKWDKSTDDTTPADAIRYNLYVKTPDGKVYFTLPADKATGALKVYGTQYPLIPVNHYDLYMPETEGIEIAVSAVDNGWLSSSFASTGSSAVKTVSEEACKVYVVGQTLYLQNASDKTASFDVLNLDGKSLLQQNLAAGESKALEVKVGAYVVRVAIGNEVVAYKVATAW